MILKLICPQCKQTMNYQWDQTDISKKKKRCVYCGRSFKVQTQRV